MKSLEFLKPNLATTLAMVLAWLPSIRPAQAGYTVTLKQVGPDVVATGSGAIDLHGLLFFDSHSLDPELSPGSRFGLLDFAVWIYTGPSSSSVDVYATLIAPIGPTNLGFGIDTSASSGSG